MEEVLAPFREAVREQVSYPTGDTHTRLYKLLHGTDPQRLLHRPVEVLTGELLNSFNLNVCV